MVDGVLDDIKKTIHGRKVVRIFVIGNNTDNLHSKISRGLNLGSYLSIDNVDIEGTEVIRKAEALTTDGHFVLAAGFRFPFCSIGVQCRLQGIIIRFYSEDELSGNEGECTEAKKELQ